MSSKRPRKEDAAPVAATGTRPTYLDHLGGDVDELMRRVDALEAASSVADRVAAIEARMANFETSVNNNTLSIARTITDVKTNVTRIETDLVVAFAAKRVLLLDTVKKLEDKLAFAYADIQLLLKRVGELEKAKDNTAAPVMPILSPA